MTKTSSTRPCAFCGTEFQPAHHRQTACSPDCRKEQTRRIQRAANLRRRERDRKASGRAPWSDRPCAVCGRPFAPVRANQICCSPACAEKRHNERQRAYYRAHKDVIVRQNGAKNASVYRTRSSMTQVSCKCPRCGRMHDVHMTPVRPGFTPRIYCNRCETAVAHMAEHRDLAYESGNAVGYY